MKVRKIKMWLINVECKNHRCVSFRTIVTIGIVNKTKYALWDHSLKTNELILFEFQNTFLLSTFRSSKLELFKASAWHLDIYHWSINEFKH